VLGGDAEVLPAASLIPSYWMLRRTRQVPHLYFNLRGMQRMELTFKNLDGTILAHSLSNYINTNMVFECVNASFILLSLCRSLFIPSSVHLTIQFSISIACTLLKHVIDPIDQSSCIILKNHQYQLKFHFTVAK